MNDLPSITAYLIDRLSRIETTLTALDKTVRVGNGVPGVMQRHWGIWSRLESHQKGSRYGAEPAFIGFGLTLALALLGASVELSVAHNAREDAARVASDAHEQRQDTQIQNMSVDVAVLMAGLRGAPGPKGPHGAPGPKGDKGGIKLFGK